ncbi:G-protein coupled receptor 4-like [Rhinoderma darwinii]|uniref:G-protein coupled receptor 4-like n=1 Tax=Rhinoderma darwinii TaxID=43563 RepID=UPI003F66140B
MEDGAGTGQALPEKMSINMTQPSFFLFPQDFILTEATFPWNGTAAEYTIFLCCLYIGNTLLGLTVNILVMWAIWPQVSSSLGLPIYVVNLLCAALLECFILPFGVAYLLHRLAVGAVGCHILGLMPKVAQRTATMFTMWMFFVRYVAVSHPLNYRTFCKGWVCASVSIALWLTAFTISVAEQILSKDNETLCFPDFRFTSEWALLHLVTSVLFSHLSLIYLCILVYFISRSVKNSASVPIEQYKRISRLLVFVVVSFGLFFCPMHVVLQYHYIIMLLGKSNFQIQQKLTFLYQIMFTLNSFSAVIAPFFYIISSSTVNTRLKELIRGR